MLGALQKVVNFITKYFTIWILIGVITAYLFPDPIKPFAKWVPYCIMIVMLSMGLTVSLGDFKLVFSRPKDVFWGIVLRYLIMPVVAFTISKVLNLPPEIAVGLILVGSCPSGVASNVMTFLAKGDTALSVTVSSVNTVISPMLTPFIFAFLAGTMIHINTQALLLDILKIVLVPVALGIFLRTVASNAVDKVSLIIPVFSVGGILLTTSVGFAMSASKLSSVAAIAFIAVILHNSIGLLTGFWAARGVGMPKYKAKAISFEIGMENGGLAMALAIAHLNPLAAIPAAIFNMVHNVTGPTLASIWRAKAEKEEADMPDNTPA